MQWRSKKIKLSLYKILKEKTETVKAASVDCSPEKSRDREISRRVEVFDDLGCINQIYWRGIKCIICVTRQGKRGDKAYHERVYYISSLKLTASEFSKIIREHWLIENQLHWVKDVIFEEDKSEISDFQAASNWSILTTIGLNLFRGLGFLSITEGQRWLAERWEKLIVLST